MKLARMLAIGLWALSLAGSAAAEPTTVDEEPAWSLLRKHVHPWERYVRGFRREHHFAFSIGSVQERWQVKHLGSIQDRRYERRSFYGKLQYSFHLPLTAGLGYFLGSSLGSTVPSPIRQREFITSSSLHLPGFLVGVVWNLNPSWRLLVGLDHYLERVLQLDDELSVPAKHLSVTMLALLDSMVVVDLFYSLNWALRLEGHWRQVYYEKPKRAAGKIEAASLKKNDQWLGIGAVYHFL